jgi:hypothetical protein
VPHLEISWQAPRRFRDDFQTARHRVDGTNVRHEALTVEPFGKLRRQVDVMQNIAERDPLDQNA